MTYRENDVSRMSCFASETFRECDTSRVIDSRVKLLAKVAFRETVVPLFNINSL